MAIQSLSREEILGLLRAAKQSSLRDWLLITTAFRFGLRASEVTAFQKDAIHNGHLIIQRLKGSLLTDQEIPESDEPLLNLRKALIEHAGAQPDNQPVFNLHRSTFWRIMQRHAKAAGLPPHKRHPHILKHSIAMQTIEKAGIENVRQFLGHKSISSTGAYLKVSDAEAVRAVWDALKFD